MAAKTGLSTLNPYAASYIPLSKRELDEKINVAGPEVTTKAANISNQAISFVNDGSAPKNPSSDSFYGSSSQSSSEMTDHQIMDDLFDMHLEYLQMQFPRISDDSLNDVYIANKGDLEATVDMLQQLEFDPFESPENLPDSLDIGSIAELGPAGESDVKIKNAVGEGCSSGSGSKAPDAAVVA